MSDPWDRIREHEDGLRYDDFYCAPHGTYGHPGASIPAPANRARAG